MSANTEGYPQDEFLPGFLPNSEQRPLFAFEYKKWLEETARTLAPEQEGAFRATVVAQCPTTNEAWTASGATAGYGEDTYQAIFLATVANSVRDPAVTTAMLDRLRPITEQLRERIPSDLAQTMVTRVLVASEAHPDAAVEAVKWASNFTADPSAAVQAALRHQKPDGLSALMSVLAGLGQGEQFEETIKAYNSQVAERAERQREAEERRAEAAAQRQAQQERHDYVVNNAVQAFTEAATSHGLTTAAHAMRLHLVDTDELLLAASCVVAQAERGSVDNSGENAAVGTLANAVLNRAVELRRTGMEFPSRGYSLDQHEERPVVTATSVDDFWNKLAQLSEWRQEMTPQTVGNLYGDWRKRFIANRQQERARSVLKQYEIDPNTDFRPEGIDSLSVQVGKGAVAYDSVDEIISDMRTYFVPRMDRFDPGATAAETVAAATGNIAVSSVLSLLNPDGDGGIMDRLEDEIREWAARKDAQPYRDSWDNGDGDPYKYSGGLFTGHGIGVARGADGGFRLTLGGRGYGGYNPDRPEQQIEDFAAFAGKDVAYEGGITLEYKGEPPTELVKSTHTSTRSRRSGEETITEEMVDISFPAEAALRNLQGLLKLSEKTVAELWHALENPTEDDKSQVVREGSIAMSVSDHHSLQGARRSAQGDRLDTRTTIYRGDRVDSNYFFLPQMKLHIESADPALQATLTRTFHAIGTIVRLSERKRYSHGYTAGHGSFQLYNEI